MEQINSAGEIASSAPEIQDAPPPAPVPEVVIPSVPGGRRYGTLCILFPQFDGDALAACVNDIKPIFENVGAAIISADNMGRRTLTYKVKKQSEGVYLNFVYSALPSAISSIERDLRHKESIMRFLTSVEQ